MNKVFKIVWSKTKGCYVVASEFAKSHQSNGNLVVEQYGINATLRICQLYYG